jgi:tetratricopeptide (TPR) repeat protein
MEEDKFGIFHEEEINAVVNRYEKMRKNNENYFFDVVEFETIIDYYLDSNNPGRAFDVAFMASAQHPNSASIQLRKARVLLDKGRAVEALRILKKLELIEPGNADVFIAKGTAMGILGDINGAKKMFDHSLTVEPDDTVNILFAITTVLQNLNYYEHLIPYLKKLIALEPDFHTHKYDLAYAFDRTNDFTNALKTYREYLEEEPFSDSAWYNMGIIYNKLDQFNEALEAYDYALAINDQNSFALFNKANILSTQGLFSEAIPVYLEYLETEPDSFEAMTYLGECYDKTSNPDLSAKYYNEAISMAPDFPDAWVGLGLLALNTGDTEKSMVYFRKAAKLDDENPEVWYLIGRVYSIKQEYKFAVQSFREALKLDPVFADPWLELGKIIMSEGISKKALPQLEQAFRATGDVPGINYLLAAFYLKQNNHAAVYRHLHAALELESTLYEEFRQFFDEDSMNSKTLDLLKKYKAI